MKKALVLYYSQTGQALDIIQSISRSMRSGFQFTFEEIKPKTPFPFPWEGMSFYQAFPESVKEIPCELEQFNFDPSEKYDLIILAFQVWYLSPSIPISSFLQSSEAIQLIKNKPVLTVQGVRNMWIMSQERIKKRINDMGGNLVGNIVLVDKNPNLVSVVTIVRWMLKGERHGAGFYGKLFPRAGVTEKDIQSSGKFGKIILDAFNNNDLEGLQDKLIDQGAVKINPVLLSIEKRGFMMFKVWSKFILKKGGYGSKEREGRLKLFKYYLFAVIYLLSPIGSIVIYVIHKLTPMNTKRLIDYYSHNQLK